jgi:hypothetical protein
VYHARYIIIAYLIIGSGRGSDKYQACLHLEVRLPRIYISERHHLNVARRIEASLDQPQVECIFSLVNIVHSTP